MSTLTLTLIFLFCAIPAWAAFPSGWGRSCVLTIDHTKVAGALTDFPVLVGYRATSQGETNLPDEMMISDGENAAQANGGDIRFTLDAAGTLPLPYEMVTFAQAADAADARAEFWVRLPELSAAVDTTFYVWYKAADVQTTPAAADPQWGSQAVWNNAFRAVWHFPNGTTLTLGDSTGLNAGTNISIAAGAGMINGGGVFSESYLQPTVTNTTISFTNEQSFTLSIWMNPTGYNPNTYFSLCNTLFSRGPASTYNYRLQVNDANAIAFIKRIVLAGGVDEGLKHYAFTGLASLTGNWTLVTLVWSAESASLYLNGAFIETKVTGRIRPMSGDVLQVGGTSHATLKFIGSLDEPRIAAAARSADWIATEYNNQSAPDLFLTDGAPAAAGHPSSTTGISTVTGIASMTL